MGVKDDFMGASVMLKVAFIVLLLANFFNWLAFTTPSWGVVDGTNNDDTHYGIWRVGKTKTLSVSYLDGYAKSWYGAFQAFSIFGYVPINVAFLLIVLYLFVESFNCKKNAEAAMAAAILCFVGAVCWLIAVIIFGAEAEDDIADVEMGYSFGMAIISLILAVVSGILIFISSRGGGSTAPAK